MTLFKGVYRSTWCCNHIKPRYFHSCWTSLSSLLQLACPRLGTGGGGLSPLVSGTLPLGLPLQCSNGPDTKESLDSGSCNGSSYPISDQDLLVLVTWTNVPNFSTSFPVDPLTGVPWEDLHCRIILKSARTVHGQAGHRILILHAPYMVKLVTGSWSYLGQSKSLIFNWVGGWDVWAVHQLTTSKLPGVFCKPQSISRSEGCSCNRVQCLSVFFVC